jgi:hypothetical protein
MILQSIPGMPRTLAGRLATFFAALAPEHRRVPAADLPDPNRERLALANQLLKTLSDGVLVETGYRKPRRSRRRLHALLHVAAPRPVGDLARPR